MLGNWWTTLFLKSIALRKKNPSKSVNTISNKSYHVAFYINEKKCCLEIGFIEKVTYLSILYARLVTDSGNSQSQINLNTV